MIEVVCSEARLPKPNMGFGVGKQRCRDWVGSLWHIWGVWGGDSIGLFLVFFFSVAACC